MTKHLLFSFLFLAQTSLAQIITGKVIKVSDGDTFTMLTEDGVVGLATC